MFISLQLLLRNDLMITTIGIIPRPIIVVYVDSWCRWKRVDRASILHLDCVLPTLHDNVCVAIWRLFFIIQSFRASRHRCPTR